MTEFRVLLHNNQGRWPLLERLIGINPQQNIIKTAIDAVKTAENIQTFVDEYGSAIDEVYKSGNGEEIALSNVGYFLGYYPKEVVEHWYNADTRISHPVFGRNTNISPENAFSAGVNLGRQISNRVDPKTKGN